MLAYLYTGKYSIRDDEEEDENVEGVEGAGEASAAGENKDRDDTSGEANTHNLKLPQRTIDLKSKISLNSQDIEDQFWHLYGDILFHIHMFLLGDEFLIPGLKTFATSKMRGCIDKIWKSLSSADLLRCIWEEMMSLDREIRDVFYKTVFLYFTEVSRSIDKDLIANCILLLAQLLAMSSNDPTPSHLCPRAGCDEVLTSQIMCVSHFEEVPPPPETAESFPCPWPSCNQDFPEDWICHAHYTNAHLQRGGNGLIGDDDEEEPPFVCPWPRCGQQYSEKIICKAHYEMMHMQGLA